MVVLLPVADARSRVVSRFLIRNVPISHTSAVPLLRLTSCNEIALLNLTHLRKTKPWLHLNAKCTSETESRLT